MQEVFIQYIFLILIILALVMVANKIKLAYPIVLVAGGLALSFASQFSDVRIDPEWIFFIFLPPLLYEAAWQISWKEFWKWKRIIASFAFPIVIVNAFVVAAVSVALIPGFTWPLGFLLGGIISPPDAISASTIMRQVKAPKSLQGIAEGESLLNDASSLIVFRFALAAVITGQFNLQQATMSFFLVVIMGILIGVAIGFAFYAVHRWLPVTPSIEVVMTFMAPYCMYYAAEHFHFSGVLAVVSGGLLLSSKRQSMLSYISRIQAINTWGNLVFVMNGIIFLLIGLQMPAIVQQMGEVGLATAIKYGLVISLVLIVTRLTCTLGASLFTMFMSRFISVGHNRPGWRMPFIFGWAGMRGVVSLASALAIPLLLSDGSQFPYRNLILFITFVVILVTLVFQGLTLPWVIKKLLVKDWQVTIPDHEQEKGIQKEITQGSLSHLEEKFTVEDFKNEHLQGLRDRLKTEMNFFDSDIASQEHISASSRNEFMLIYLKLLERQRAILENLNRSADYDDDIIRKYQFMIDLEEYRVRGKLLQEME